jgi:hypothetical protein
MASLRTRNRRDGSSYHAVLYRLSGKQTSTSFHDYVSAVRFRDLVDKIGPAKALEATVGPDPVLSAMTVAEWLEHHISHLTGLAKSTLADYRAYSKNDITSVLGPIPLSVLSRDDIARWTQAMTDRGASGKTIANKHGFLSSALNAAVKAGHIGANPAVGQRLPRTEQADMVCLSREEFAGLLDAVTATRTLVRRRMLPSEPSQMTRAQIDNTDLGWQLLRHRLSCGRRSGRRWTPAPPMFIALRPVGR